MIDRLVTFNKWRHACNPWQFYKYVNNVLFSSAQRKRTPDNSVTLPLVSYKRLSFVDWVHEPLLFLGSVKLLKQLRNKKHHTDSTISRHRVGWVEQDANFVKNCIQNFLRCKVRQDCFSIGFHYRKFDSGHAGIKERFSCDFEMISKPLVVLK